MQVQNIFIYERIIILLKKHSYMSLPTGDYVIRSLVQSERKCWVRGRDLITGGICEESQDDNNQA